MQVDKSMVKILSSFVAFLENINFNELIRSNYESTHPVFNNFFYQISQAFFLSFEQVKKIKTNIGDSRFVKVSDELINSSEHIPKQFTNNQVFILHFRSLFSFRAIGICYIPTKIH